MFRYKKVILLTGIAIMLVALLGCSADTDTSLVVDSGVLDEGYNGIPDPVLEKNLKLSEEEKKNGVEKITIKCGVQIDKPTSETDEPADEASEADEQQEESGGDERDERAKPKI
jgi:hypothetical protein